MQFEGKGFKRVIQSSTPYTNQNRQQISQSVSTRQSRSPISKQITEKRSPFHKSSIESGFGEMLYVDPSEINLNRIGMMSPLASNNNQSRGRSPTINLGQSVFSVVRNDLEKADYPYESRQSIHLELDKMEKNKKRISRSPKTINIGESPQEVEYNIRTLNAGKRSPTISKETIQSNYNIQQPQYQSYQSYINMPTNEPGNIFLDQPMVQTNYMQPGEQQPIFMNNNLENKGSGEFVNTNTREIQYNMNPRDLKETNFNGFNDKMSPNKNVDDENDSNSEKNDNPTNQIKDLKMQMEQAGNLVKPDIDGMNEGNVEQNIQNDIEKIEDFNIRRKNPEINMTEAEIKKLIKQMTKGYDPKIGKEGRLISTSQEVIPSSNNDIFIDRYRVLKKMNKLSSILLSKNKTLEYDTGSFDRSFDEQKRNFNTQTLKSTNIKNQKKRSRSPQNKFLYLSLAMLASKGPSAEDRIILRKMRFDKGGVVDLAQELIRKKNPFKIKRITKSRGRISNTINPKYREKAAQVVQSWWRGLKERYQKILQQIIKIQSVWRGKWLRKYIYDIIYISFLYKRFFEILEKVLISHIRPYVWQKLFGGKKWAKEALANLLIEKDWRFSLLRSRFVIERWKENNDFMNKKIFKGRKMVNIRYNDHNRKMLLKRNLNEWNLKTNLLKYILQSNDQDRQKRKFFAALDILNGTKKLSKKTALNSSMDQLKKFLLEIIKKIKLKKVFKKMVKFRNYILKQGIYKWRFKLNYYQMKDLRHGIFGNMYGRVDSRLNKIKLKKYFEKWKKILPKKGKLPEILKALELLERFCKRSTYEDPFKAIKLKFKFNEKTKGINKMIQLKKKYLNSILRNYLQKWKNKSIKVEARNKYDKLYKALLLVIHNKLKNRILQKRFNKWRQRPKIDINDIYDKNKLLANLLELFIKKIIKKDKEIFMKKLRKTKGETAFKKVGGKLLSKYLIKDKNKLRHYFYKWKSKARDLIISDLKGKVIKFLYLSNYEKNKRNILSQFLSRWKLFSSSGKHYDNIDKLRKVREGYDKINKLYINRAFQILMRLYRKMNKDLRGRYIISLSKRLMKPRITLRDAFNIWKRIIEIDNSKNNIKILKGKIIKGNAGRIKERNRRELLIKSLYKWKAECKKPEEYYPKIINGINIISHIIKNKLCKKPFDKIKKSKNYNRKLINLLNKKRHSQKKFNKEMLRNKLNKWKDQIRKNDIKDLKSNFIFKTKKGYLKNQKDKILMKYLTRWKLYRRKGLDYKFTKGLNIIENIIKKPFRKLILESFKNKVNNSSKNKGLKSVLKTGNSFKNYILHKTLLQWWKKSVLLDTNKQTKRKYRLRRLIRYKTLKPLYKYFKLWQSQLKKSQLKDKDIEKVKNIITHFLRTNDRLNLNYAINLWKKQINKIREQYLKSLLIKQIKQSQNLKENTTLKAKLHKVLLKWRSTIYPANYYDIMKRIKRGLRTFKRGLKKRDERKIYNGIKEKAIYKILLDILKIKQRIVSNIKKKSFNIWLNKIGDTNKMKNKIKKLFNDYMSSKKINKAIYKDQIKEIIELMNYYNNIKKEKALDIINFIKNSLLANRTINIMKKSLFLNKRLKLKEKSLIKKAHEILIKYNRNIQKIKNNEKAYIIQRFLKAKSRKPEEKRQRIIKGVNLIDKIKKKHILKNILLRGKDKHIKKILLRRINQQDMINNKLLRNELNKWKKIIPLLKQHDYATMIEKNYRILKSKQKLKGLKKRALILKRQFHRYNDFNNKKLKLYLNIWKRKNELIKNMERITKIQDFLKEKINNLHKKQHKDKLKNIFTKKIIKDINLIMKMSSRMIGGKREALYKTLEDIFYKKPFNKLMNALKWIGRIKTLKKVHLKTQNVLIKYFLPKTIKKWHNNTYNISDNKSKIIQKWLKNKYNSKKQKDNQRLKFLLFTIINKLIRNNKLKIKIPFNVWSKRVNSIKCKESAIKIQNTFRNYLGKIEGDKIESNKKLRNLFRKKIIYQISDIIVEISRYLNPIKEAINNLDSQMEKRYTINNMMNSTNNLLKIKHLTNLMSKRLYTDSISALKRYLNKWKQYNSYSQKFANIIQNNFRSYLSKKKRYNIKNINRLLKKFFDKKDKSQNTRKIVILNKWNSKSKLIGFNNNANKIIKFLKKNLMKNRNKMIKNYFIENGRKLVNHRINQLVKFNLLIKILRKIFGKSFLKKLKINYLAKIMLNIILKRFYHLDDKSKKIYLSKYLNQWKNKKDKINNYNYKMITRIQNNYRKILAERELNRLKGIRDRLKRNFLRRENKVKNQKRLAIKKWKYNAKIINYTNSSKIIQDFMNEIKRKIENKNDMIKKLKIEKGLNKLFNIAFHSKYIFNKILSERNRKIFENFNNILMNKRNDIIKEVFKTIKDNVKDYSLNKILRIKNDLRNRILKNIISTWKNNTDKKSRNHAAELIQKNYNNYKNKIKKNKKEGLLKNILRRLINYNSNIKKIYLKKWKKNNEQSKIKSASQRINRFITQRYRIAKARNNWKKLSQLYLLNNRNSNVVLFVDKIKKLIAIKKIIKSIVKNNRKRVIHSLIKNNRNTKIENIMKLIVRKYHTDNNFKLLFSLRHWNKKNKKIIKRDEIFNKALNNIDKIDKIFAIDTYNKVSLIKKLLNEIQKVRLLDSFNKLKKYNEMKKTFEKISSAMTKSKSNLILQNKEQLIRKIYKLYAYQKINKMMETINKYKKNKFLKEFINKLSRNLSNKTEFKLKGHYSSSNQTPKINFSFKKQINKKPKIINDKLLPFKKILPFFIKYLQNKINKRKLDAFNKINKYGLYESFVKLYNNYINNIIKNSKKELINKLKKNSEDYLTKVLTLSKLYNLFKTYYIKKLTKSLKETIRIYKILYLLKMIRMHKRISKLRFIREVIRKWRFNLFVQKMARKKMEKMYKNLHVSYLKMVNEVFGDEDEVNPSVIKEFERFGNNLGMFNNEEPDAYDNKGFYQSVQKKYIFDSSFNDNSYLDFGNLNNSNLNNFNENKEEDEKEIQKENRKRSHSLKKENLKKSINLFSKFKNH